MSINSISINPLIELKKLIFILFLFISSGIVAQDNLLNNGYSTQERKEKLEIISAWEPEFQRNPTKDLAIRLADAFLYIKKYKKAISFYEHALSLEQLNEKEMLNYFSALYEFGDIATAEDVAKEYYIRFGRMTLKAKVDSLESMSKSTPVFLENYLGMNTKNNEYGLYPMFADYRIINSDIPTLNNELNEVNSKYKNYINPYVVSLMDTANEKPKLYSLVKNDKALYTITHYDEKSRKVFITQNVSPKFNIGATLSGTNTMKIFIATIDAYFKLGELEEFQYNSNSYSVGQACVSKDGQSMYFVSDMPGGYGGTDIYRCMKLEDGTWGTPINLGNIINTSGNEMFPYMSPQGNMLYFSSTGHSIFGGLDLNKSQKTRFNTFGKPVNLGLPFNSNKDDFGIVFLDNSGTSGFFSSNRQDGMGGIDIYKFNYEQQETSEKVMTKKPSPKPIDVDVHKPLNKSTVKVQEDDVDFRRVDHSKNSTINTNKPVEKTFSGSESSGELEFKK